MWVLQKNDEKLQTVTADNQSLSPEPLVYQLDDENFSVTSNQWENNYGIRLKQSFICVLYVINTLFYIASNWNKCQDSFFQILWYFYGL